MIGGPAYWALTRHADFAAVSRDGKRFSTSENRAIIRCPGGTARTRVEQSRA